jgi:hypothetical protein
MPVISRGDCESPLRNDGYLLFNPFLQPIQYY